MDTFTFIHPSHHHLQPLLAYSYQCKDTFSFILPGYHYLPPLLVYCYQGKNTFTFSLPSHHYLLPLLTYSYQGKAITTYYLCLPTATAYSYQGIPMGYFKSNFSEPSQPTSSLRCSRNSGIANAASWLSITCRKYRSCTPK